MNLTSFGLCSFSVFAALALSATGSAEPSPFLRVPVFTAYSEPNPEVPEIPEEAETGVRNWSDPKSQIVWYGRLNATGRLDLSLAMNLPKSLPVRLSLDIAPVNPPKGQQAHMSLEQQIATAKGQTSLNLGSVAIPFKGYYWFALHGVSKAGETFGEPLALVLDGPAAKGAHFNLKPRRNAASVHLTYPLPSDLKVKAFYNEVTVRTEPLWSYYMACGFHRGYFGIQVNSPTERRIIFSVWDAGEEPTDRGKVSSANKVQLLSKGEGVVAEGFGNEGTGGHSHLVYPWKRGQTYRFLVTAQPEGTSTTYSGWFYFPEKKRWGLIARFRAPKDGDYLHGLYSFNENFGGANGHLERRAEFGPGWVEAAGDGWRELRTARFSHDGTGKEDRLDYNAGVVGGRFFLSNGGFLDGSIRYGDEFTRPTSPAGPPSDLPLPPK